MIDDLVAALEAQEIVLEQYYAELGHGQHEISTGHAPALTAVDEQIFMRETIRADRDRPRPGRLARAEAVAAERRQRLPHPLLAVGGRSQPLPRSRRARAACRPRRASFIAGVLEHLPGLCGLTAPSFNSYHRIIPHYWAGAFTCWGLDNREAPVRVPSLYAGREEASTNAELKAADASCNPYLAVGGLIAAGLDGIERGLEPPEPVQVDPGDAVPRPSGTRRGSGRCRRASARRSTRSPPTRC